MDTLQSMKVFVRVAQRSGFAAAGSGVKPLGLGFGYRVIHLDRMSFVLVAIGPVAGPGGPPARGSSVSVAQTRSSGSTTLSATASPFISNLPAFSKLTVIRLPITD